MERLCRVWPTYTTHVPTVHLLGHSWSEQGLSFGATYTGGLAAPPPLTCKRGGLVDAPFDGFSKTKAAASLRVPM